MLPPNILTILKAYLTGSQWQSAADLFKTYSDLTQFLIANNEWEILKTCFYNLPATKGIDANSTITIGDTTCSVLWHLARENQLELFDIALTHSSNPDLNIKPTAGKNQFVTIFNFLATYKEWERLKKLIFTFKKLDLSSIKTNESTQEMHTPILYDALEEKRYDVIQAMQKYHPREFYRNLGYFLFVKELLPVFRNALTTLKQHNIYVDLNFAPYGKSDDITYHNELFSDSIENLFIGMSLTLLISLRLTKPDTWESELLLTLEQIFTHHQPINIHLTSLIPGQFHNLSIFKILYRGGYSHLLSLHMAHCLNPTECADIASAHLRRDEHYNQAVSAINTLSVKVTKNQMDYWLPKIMGNFTNAVALGHPLARCHAAIFYSDLFRVYSENHYEKAAFQLIISKIESIYLIFLDDLLFNIGKFCITSNNLLAIAFLSEALLLVNESSDVFNDINLLLLNTMATKLEIEPDFNIIKAHQNFIELMQKILTVKIQLFEVTPTEKISINSASSASTPKALCNLIAVKNINFSQYQLVEAQMGFFAKSAPRLITTNKIEFTPQNNNVTSLPTLYPNS